MGDEIYLWWLERPLLLSTSPWFPFAMRRLARLGDEICVLATGACEIGGPCANGEKWGMGGNVCPSPRLRLIILRTPRNNNIMDGGGKASSDGLSAGDMESKKVGARADEKNKGKSGGGGGGGGGGDDDTKVDRGLFDKPPPPEDCPICMVPLPLDPLLSTYKICCGKLICGACYWEHQRATHLLNVEKAAEGEEPRVEDTCAFCKTPLPTSEDEVRKRTQARAELNDPVAIHQLAFMYQEGEAGLPKDEGKYLQLQQRAADMGLPPALYNLATDLIDGGTSLGRDGAKGRQYLKMAAKKGLVQARTELAVIEFRGGNRDAAVQHFRIAEAAGSEEAIGALRTIHRRDGHLLSESELEASRQSMEEAQNEVHSESRDRYMRYLKTGLY